MGQATNDMCLQHHGAVTHWCGAPWGSGLVAHGHRALWGCISPLRVDVGYCRAVPPMRPLWGIVEVSPMALSYRAPGFGATPL